MTEISVRNLVENDRTDVPHLFGFVKIIRNQENQVLIKIIYGWQFGRKNDQGWNFVKKRRKKTHTHTKNQGEKNKKMKVLRMGLPIVEHLSGLQEIIFSLYRSP